MPGAPIGLLIDGLLVVVLLVAAVLGARLLHVRLRGTGAVPARPVTGSELARRMLSQQPRR